MTTSTILRNALLATSSVLLLSAAAAPPPPTTFTGCAMPLEDNKSFITLCQPDDCFLLRGNVDTKLAGHTITVSGTFHDATSNQPRTIQVDKVLKTADKCSATCKPSIDGRGLHDRPKAEGGTPGVKPANPPPPS